jgi:hypothetical protein
MRFVRALSVGISVAALGGAQGAWGDGAPEAPRPPSAFAPIDYAKVERTIARQPPYVASPRYALFVFDGAGTFRVWAVIDKSTADGPYYDVLYFDRNGNGDLTEPEERLTTTHAPDRDPAGLGVTFSVGDVAVPGTEEKHTKLIIATKPKAGLEGVWFRMRWRGKTEVSGGYGVLGRATTRWTDAPATAPILRPTAEGPLSFAVWGTGEIAFTGSSDLPMSVLVGHRGHGPDTLCVLDETFLDLEKDSLTVAVIGKDESGHEVQETTRIKQHC